ncbi:nitrilase-related carbon-nitrogen hydrolase [Sulfuricurvum sp.]|uniref:nitrilase-related carbon-nitrogen hydrolase n=1 Tax=Sulfuricurvum sp. TaxID=2025608 RepID=UPI002D6407C6|nr:nitrilase-related carbon-nitrogen hydrolase [Sulfuricurvum sp.]HZF70507.1 nitrilase-related carbon-nitrogen hydrolase [Sulfuricurvum sp.]
MKIALIQSAPKLNRSNLHDVLRSVYEHKDADVVIFPELALSGYLLQDKLYEDAWKIEELNELSLASNECDIVIGAALWDEGKVYNCALYFSKGQVIHIHRKNHLPTYGMFEEGRYFTAGDEITSFMTPYGEAIMVVCEDVWRAETIAAIAASEAQIVYVLAASPARGFNDEELEIQSQWDALLKTTALLSHNYVVFVNRVGFEDGLGFWGGSRVVSPMGAVETVLPLFESSWTSIELNNSLQKVGRYLAKNF